MTTPFIRGCKLQEYSNFPDLLKTKLYVAPGPILPDENEPSLAATLWSRWSALVHVTVSPAFTVTDAGSYFIPLMFACTVDGLPLACTNSGSSTTAIAAIEMSRGRFMVLSRQLVGEPAKRLSVWRRTPA